MHALTPNLQARKRNQSRRQTPAKNAKRSGPPANSAVHLNQQPQQAEAEQEHSGHHGQATAVVSTGSGMEWWTGRDWSCHERDNNSSQVSDTSRTVEHRVWRNALNQTNRFDGPNGERWVVPPCAGFLSGDIRELPQIVNAAESRLFDLIIADPPYENKSAKRRRAYDTMPVHELLSIDVRQCIGREGAHVLVWVTNKNDYIDFVIQRLFPAWGVRYECCWLWTKVTQEGCLVRPISCTHRRPYELIVCGFAECSTPEQPETMLGAQKVNEGFSLPRNLVLVSSPQQHSRKPSLKGLVEMLLHRPTHGLELFARNLTPGWWSIGNQVLMFQNESHLTDEK
eukprot:c16099_g1_i2.p1 GENE.c16099_g1_i2~~c16099_g1_i2.p1  ORF type:complete len:340 (-),score=44.93 c16099_g1_i2:110-1129(-)